VIVVPLIDVNGADTKEPLKHVETIDALRALCHRKLVRHLESGCVAPPTRSVGLTNEVDRKTTFTVDKTGNPTNQSFLLIFRS
jgi:hypothetical protein